MARHLDTVVALQQALDQLQELDESLAGVPPEMRELHDEYTLRKEEIDALEATIAEAELRRRLERLLGRHETADPALSPRPQGTPDVGSAAVASGGQNPIDPRTEIQRLARIMLSDLKLYNPDRFSIAVQDGRLLETFRNELIRGKDLITSRFPDLPERLTVLTAALRKGIEEERSAVGATGSGSIA